MIIKIKGTHIRVELTIGQCGDLQYYYVEPKWSDPIKEAYGCLFERDEGWNYIADESQIEDLENKVNAELDKINQGKESKILDRWLELNDSLDARKSQPERFDENGCPKNKYILKKHYWHPITQTVLNGMSTQEIAYYLTHDKPEYPDSIVIEEVCRRAGNLDELQNAKSKTEANNAVKKAAKTLGVDLGVVTDMEQPSWWFVLNTTLGGIYYNRLHPEAYGLDY